MGNRIHAEFDPSDVAKKNLFINGDFIVDQRSTAITTNGYSTDRWKITTLGATFSAYKSVSSDTTVGFYRENIQRLQLTGTGGNLDMRQFIEDDKQLRSGGTYTLSFWARTVTGGVAGQFLDILARQWESSTVASDTATVASSVTVPDAVWTKYEFTFTMPAYSGAADDYYGADVRISVDTSAVTMYDFARMKLERSDVATPFVSDDPATSLAKCQRYYWDSRSGSQDLLVGASAAAAFDRLYDSFMYPVEMRVNPAVTRINVQLNNINTFAFERQSSRGFATQCRAQTAGVFYVVFRVQADAEL